MPDSNPLYELVGGYYPGDPIPRKKPPYVNKPQPMEFNSDVMIDEYLNALKRDLNKQGISEQAKKLFIKDVERTLVVQTRPKGASYDPMRALELGDEEDVAGVQVKMDINPVSWIKDPEKMLKDTASGFVKDLVNWNDLDSYLERNAMWSPLIAGLEADDLRQRYEDRGERGGEGMARRYERDVAPAFEDPLVPGVENVATTDSGDEFVVKPFQLINTGSKKTNQVILMDKGTTKAALAKEAKEKGTPQSVSDAITDNAADSVLKGEDMYEAVAESYMNFVKNRRSSGSRNGAFNDHVLNSARAVGFELKQLVNDKNITDKNAIAKINDFHKEEKLYRTVSKFMGTYDLDVFDFDDYHNLDEKTLKAMKVSGEITYGQGIGHGIGSFTSKLELAAHGNEPAGSVFTEWNRIFGSFVDDKTGEVTAAGSLTKLKKVLEDSDNHFEKVGGAALASYKERTQSIRKMIGKMEKFKDDNQELIDNLKESIEKDKAPIRAVREKLKKELGDNPTLQNVADEMGITVDELKKREYKLSAYQKRKFRDLKGNVDYLKEGFTREGIIKGDLEQLSFGFAQDVLLDPEFLDLIHSEESIIGAKGESRVTSTVLNTFIREDTFDLAEKLREDGVVGIAGDYAWNMFRKRLNGNTPAAVLNSKLEKTHYFGLKYIEKYGPGGELEFSGIDRINNRLAKKKRFLNIQEFDFTNEKDASDLIRSIGKFKFVGDTNLSLAFDLHKRLISKSGATALDRKGFMALINGRPTDKHQYLTQFKWNYFRLDDKGQNFMLQRASGLRKWLKEHNNKLGLEFDQNGRLLDTNKNYEILKSVFAKLYKGQGDPTLISLAQKYAGRLDKLSQYFNKLQAGLFSKVKFLSPLSYVGNILAERGAGGLVKILRKNKVFSSFVNKIVGSKGVQAIYKILSKILGSVLGAATGGVGKAVWAIIERLAYVAIQKVTNFFKKIAESFRKGDIGIISGFVEKGAEAIFKSCGLLAGCFSLLFFVVIFPILAMLTSITPVDPTRMAFGLEDRAGDGGGDGASSVCSIPGVCDLTGVVGCFEFKEQKGSEWPAGHQEIIEKAAENLLGAGHYVNRLCDYGPIEVVWNPSTACGQMLTKNRIGFGAGDCYGYREDNQKWFNWLFAHETGHIYHARAYQNGDVLRQARLADCGNSQPTYVGGSGESLNCSFNMGSSLPGQREDFAELVGNFVMFINKCDETNQTGGDMNTFFNTVGPWNQNCPNAFKGHYDWAMENLFGPP